jgi:hypothetical protein
VATAGLVASHGGEPAGAGLGQAQGAGAAHRPAQHPDLRRAGAQPQARQQRQQLLQQHPQRVVTGAGPPAAAAPVGRGQRERPHPADRDRLGQVPVEAEPLEGGVLVPAGGVQQQADRQPVAGS